MKISVVGLGKLGSPLLGVLASKGHQVIGIDINQEFIQKINQGIAPVEEPCLQELISVHHLKISATSNYDEAILNTDVTFVIVPTPSDKTGVFSNQYVLKAVEQIGLSLTKKQSYHLIIITSTVMPGSTEGEIKTMIEKTSKKKVGHDLGLCYSPEFIALGTVVRNMLFPDMLLIGESDSKAGDILEKIYRSVCENNPPVRRMNFVNAEISKIAVNTFVTTKISYANMLSDICQSLPGGNVDMVTQAVGLDSRIGEKYLKAGVAFGGPCFPRDNHALGALANSLGARADLAIATGEINRYQNYRLQAAIETHGKSDTVSILGLSYKPGSYVVEESQGIQISNLLAENGFKVSVYDPMALAEGKKVLSKKIQIASSVEECITHSDTLVIMTPWPEFSQQITPALLQKMTNKKVIIDCWRQLPYSQFSKVCDLIYMGYGDHFTNSHAKANAESEIAHV